MCDAPAAKRHGSVRKTVSNAQVKRCDSTGIHISAADATGPGISLTMNGGVIGGSSSGNQDVGVSIDSRGGGYSVISVLLNGVTISNSRGVGIEAIRPGAVVRVNGCTVTGNGVGIQALVGAVIATFGNNRVFGNSENGAFTQTLGSR